jgi:hypothetical protein
MAADETRLWIDFAAPAGRLGEAEIAELLTPLAEHVAELSLNRAAAGDAVLALAATMPLTRLELRETGVGDAAVLKLAGHATLETLVLTQTGVTDACVDALAGMPALKRVYVWGSRLTPEGVARLRRERPGLAVDAGDAPAAAPLATEEPPKLTKGAAAAPALAPPGSAPVNTVCPVSGSPVNVKYTIVFEGRLVGFCCPNCPAKFWAKPDDYASKLGK